MKEKNLFCWHVTSVLFVVIAIESVFGFWSHPSSYHALTKIRQPSTHCQRFPTSELYAKSDGEISSSTSKIATLTEETLWNIRFVFQKLPTTDGKTITNQMIFTTRGQFLEDIGYEPPQGIFRQIPEEQDDDDKENDDLNLIISNSRWTLSEDPNDRKDSLWIWGLFKEPLYPFLLLQMEIDEIELKDATILPFKLFAQINHRRGENGEVILTSGADLKIKKKETVNADPFGAATVDIFEDEVVGKIQLQAITK